MDVVMTGCWVVDGTGAPAYRADLAVDKGVVAAIGRLQHVEAAQRIDCTGLYLLPGFVDATYTVMRQCSTPRFSWPP